MPHSRLSSLVITVGLCALVLNACGGNATPYTPLTTDNPVVQNADGLTVSANPNGLSADFGVQINALSAEALQAQPADAAWNQALQALPANLSLISSIFELHTTGPAPNPLYLSVIVPTSADARTADVYAWDGAQWAFVPAEKRGQQAIAAMSTVPLGLALFAAAPMAPRAFISVAPGQALTAAAAEAATAILLEGVTVNAEGTLGGQLPNVALDRNYAVYPVVALDEVKLLSVLLADDALRAAHVLQLAGLAASADYDGIVLRYTNVSAEQKPLFLQLASEVARQLHAQQKTLWVQLPLPDFSNSTATNTGGYDWVGLGVAADGLLIPIADTPADYRDADQRLRWATSQVSRHRLYLLTSAASMESTQGAWSTVDYASALQPFGTLTLTTATAAHAGDTLTVQLSGGVQTVSYDAEAFAPRYTYTDDAGAEHTRWLVDNDTMSARLKLAQDFHLGGVALRDVLAAGAPANLAEALTQYKINALEIHPPEVALVWTVSTGGAVVAQAPAQPGEPYHYTAVTAGDYQFAAQLKLGADYDLGTLVVNVAEAAVVATTPAPTPISGGNTSGGGGDPAPTPSGGASGGGGGVFVPPPPIAAGTFELGGQVPGASIGHPAFMQQAGMKWVKIQTRSGGADNIAAGHAAGFKVLLSVIGDKSRVTDPAYWDEYAAWVGGLAAAGADAIEVWNEPNIDHEWPEGQISGATYTQLLAKAYTAIKAANGSTIVISAGPAPTGAEAAFPGRVMNDNNFLAQMAVAGAANYMDCVGVHYNEGILSPNQTTGDPRGSFYSRYYWSMVDVYYSAFGGTRPLCFTELGYLTGEGYGALPAYFAWAGNTTVAQQAQWLAEAASLSGNSGKVRLMIIWNVDFTLWTGDPQAGFAIVRPGGTCPACAALDAVMP